MYLELNAFLDWESNPGPFVLEPTALTVIPPYSGIMICSSHFKLMTSELASRIASYNVCVKEREREKKKYADSIKG